MNRAGAPLKRKRIDGTEEMIVSRWTMSQKLAGAFSVLLLFLALVGGFATFEISSAGRDTDRVGASVDRLAEIATSQVSLYQSQVALESAFGEKWGDKRNAFLATSAKLRQISTDEWKKFDMAIEPGMDRTDADKINKRWLAYLDGVKDIVGKASGDVDIDDWFPVLAQGNALAQSMQGSLQKQVSQAHDFTKTAQSNVSRSTLILSSVIGGVILFALWLCWALMKNVVPPIKQLTATMGQLAANRNDIEVPCRVRADELGKMAQAVQVFKENAIKLAASEREAEQSRQTAEQERKAREDERAKAQQRQTAAITAVGSGLEGLSRGDLTIRLKEAFSSEYEKLRTDFNATADSLQKALLTIQSATTEISAGTVQIAHASDDLSVRTSRQAASLEETSASLDMIANTVKTMAFDANEAVKAAATTKKAAESSGVIVEKAIDAMGKIKSSSNEITNIISLIEEIAFQTNLLALNAGVEAARAGDAGRGFAVVASEVRALAQRSAEAAKSISSLISISTSQVESGVALVDKTGVALKEIASKVAEMNTLVRQISESSNEQANGIADINTAVRKMDQIVQQNAAMVVESTAAAHKLNSETSGLSGLMRRFQVG
jgi:methyl-accepting chemotaxis protein